MQKLFILFLFFSSVASAQIKRDTSFTNHSAFIKEKKKYPFIEIASPQISPVVSTRKNIIYTSISKRDLHLDIYYSTKTRKRLPGVLLIHGGGWKSGDKSQNEALAIHLASHGYVAVTAEYRLSPEAQYPAALLDLKDAVKWIKQHASKYNLDKNKIAVLGVSAGGQLAALLGTTNRNKKFDSKSKGNSEVNAVIDIDGVLAFKHPESEEGKVAAEWLGGTYEEKSKVWEEASALTHAGKSTPPMLFINSANPRFHAGQNDLLKKVRPFNIYTEVHTVSNTPHTFWLFHPWFQPTVEIVTTFLKKILQ